MTETQATEKAPKTENPCVCAGWTIEIDGEARSTGCDGGLTTRAFIRGHDSKLKALLIECGEADWYTSAVAVLGEGGMRTEYDWRTAAGQFGFANQVSDAVERRVAKLAAKAEKQQAKEDAKAEREANAKNAAAQAGVAYGTEPELNGEDVDEQVELSQDQREADWDSGSDWGDQDTDDQP